jgi:hypothetical protein
LTFLSLHGGYATLYFDNSKVSFMLQLQTRGLLPT